MRTLKQSANGRLSPKSAKDWKETAKDKEDKDETNPKEKGKYAKTKEASR